MPVDRCVCHNLTFAHLRAVADGSGADFPLLQSLTRCSTNCGMCRPYVLLMLSTGRTVFPLLSEAEASRVCTQLGK